MRMIIIENGDCDCVHCQAQRLAVMASPERTTCIRCGAVADVVMVDVGTMAQPGQTIPGQPHCHDPQCGAYVVR